MKGKLFNIHCKALSEQKGYGFGLSRTFAGVYTKGEKLP